MKPILTIAVCVVFCPLMSVLHAQVVQGYPTGPSGPADIQLPTDTKIPDTLPSETEIRRRIEEYETRKRVPSPVLPVIDPDLPAEVQRFLKTGDLPVNPWDKKARPAEPKEITDAIIGILKPGESPKGDDLLNALKSAAHQNYLRECSEKAAALIAFRQKLGGPVTAGELQLQTYAGLREIIAGFAQNCLTTPQELEPSLRRRLDGVVGVLANPALDPPYICSVTRIDESKVMTARHCVSSPGGKITTTGLVVYLASEPARGLDVLDKTLPDIPNAEVFQKGEDVSDWVILDIQAPSEEFSGVQARQAQQLDRLVVYGYQPILELLERIEIHTGKRAEKSGWETKLAADTSSTCIAALLTCSGRCIAHACQTEAGISGAALFAHGVDPLTVVGLHTRQALVDDEGACFDDSAKQLPNFGLVLSEKLAARIRPASKIELQAVRQ
jgi:hypothetical protein